MSGVSWCRCVFNRSRSEDQKYQVTAHLTSSLRRRLGGAALGNLLPLVMIGNLARHVGLRVAANSSAVLYAWINLSAVPLALLNRFNSVACMLAMTLTVWKRRRFSNTDTRPAFASSVPPYSGPLAE